MSDSRPGFVPFSPRERRRLALRWWWALARLAFAEKLRARWIDTDALMGRLETIGAAIDKDAYYRQTGRRMEDGPPS